MAVCEYAKVERVEREGSENVGDVGCGNVDDANHGIAKEAMKAEEAEKGTILEAPVNEDTGEEGDMQMKADSCCSIC